MVRFSHLFNLSVSIAANELTTRWAINHFYYELITFPGLTFLIVQITFTLNIHAMAHEMQIEAHDTLANLPIIGLAEIEIIAQNPYQDFQLLGTQYGRLSKELLELRFASHMGSIAQEFSSAYVQTNGPGSLALLSQRGLPASRNQVVWNGFGLNHPMLGVVDLSLIPSNLFDAVLFTPGLGQARFGQSGAGSMHILQQTFDGDRIALQYSMGKYGAKQTRVHAASSKDNISWDLRVYRMVAENNFDFKKRVFDPEQRAIIPKWYSRENNDSQSHSVLFNFKKEPSKMTLKGSRDKIFNRTFSSLRSFVAKSEYQSTIWAFTQDNNIPGSKLSPSLRANQSDAYLRWIQGLRWGIRNQWRIQHFGLWQALDFKDPDKEIDSESDIWSSIIRIEHQNRLGKSAYLQSLVEWSITGVNSTDYEVTRSRWSFSHRHTLHGEYGTRNILRVDMNQAYYDDFGLNWSGELGWNSKLSPALGIRFLSAKHSVIPTFNDLYWPVLGNSDLRSEQVYSIESGLQLAQTLLHWDGGKLRTDVQLSYYWNTVNNGIRWLPDEQGLSKPLNIEAITARGGELDIALAFHHAQFSGVVKSGAYQVIAHMDKERYKGDPALNMQLRYTPKWQFKHYIHVQYKELQAMLSNSYVAERYSSADHSSPFDPLSAYSTWNASFGVEIPWAADRILGTDQVEKDFKGASRNIPRRLLWNLSWSLEINNIFSETYEQVLNYPMPGRHFMLSIQLKREGSGSRAIMSVN
tara:strand:- start:9292 stop:11538 length:2247 start_codon:yes stop_codon:yes gene_type:complete